MFTRPPASMLPVFYTLYQDPEPWESESRGHDGRPLAQNIRDAWEHLKSGDLSASPMFLDVQGDRSDPDTVAETPQLRMIEKNDEGVVVRGWKAIGTGVAFANEIFMGVLWKPGTVGEQIVFALVTANHPGVTHVVRPSLAQADADPFDRPLASRGDELDGMAYFDDVLIPWDRVFHIGNPDHAKFYPQRLFDWIHAETQIRHVVNAEMIAGLGVLITEALGHRAGADRRVPGRGPDPFPRDLPRLHDRGRGNRLHIAGRPLQAEQHLRRLRPRVSTSRTSTR